jgi:hypothetical protein
MQRYKGVAVQLQTFLALALDGGEWLASHPMNEAKRKNLPCQEQIPVVRPIAKSLQ